MADAIPVHSEPKRKPAVKPAPQVDKNGIELPGDYISEVRDGLGNPSDYGPAQDTREVTTPMDVIETVEGKSVIVQKQHTYIREDF